MSKAPRGKIPYVAISKPDSDSQAATPATFPTLLANSTLIVETLVEDGVLDDLNARLSPTEQAHDAALRALLEEKLYFYRVGVPLSISGYGALTVGCPTPISTNDGTRTITPCARTFPRRCLTLPASRRSAHLP